MDRSLLLLGVLLLTLPLLHASAEAASDLSLVVYEDGSVRVKQTFQVPAGQAEFTLPTLSRLITDAVARGSDGSLLETSIGEGFIKVKTGGASTLNISYTTLELTSKEGLKWRITVKLPSQAVIKLPDSSTVTYFDPFPEGISNTGDTTTLIMPAGDIVVSYNFGVTGIREHALAVLNELDEVLKHAKAEGLLVYEAETLQGKAQAAYSAGLYAEAETLVIYARDALRQIRNQAQAAQAEIEAADKAIQRAREEGRTLDLDAAARSLEAARAAFEAGKYSSVEALSTSARTIANSSRSELNLLLAGGTVVGLVATGAYLALYRGRRIPIQANPTPVSLEDLHRDYPNLRQDDAPVLAYVAGNPQGVYMSQLRDALQLPRSTAWRTITRLEELGAVTTQKRGRETFISLTPKSGREL